jgi:hypothetical protein
MGKSSDLAPKKSARRGRAKRLLAGARISERKIRRVIGCYARGMGVRESAAECDVSHVTVGRLFNLIRERLLAVGVYRSAEDYRDERIEIENTEEGQTFYAERFEAQLAALVGAHRGIDETNRHLYEAEAVFRIENPEATPEEIASYIYTAVRETGPLGALDQSAIPEAVLKERLRRLFAKASSGIRQLGNSRKSY